MIIKKEGFILIDKPENITSFAVVAKLRHITGFKKIGHGGTLDPFATGLLPVAIGRSFTKKINLFRLAKKTYQAVAKLGVSTTTDDLTGQVVFIYNGLPLEKKSIEKALKNFLGLQTQIAPRYSAKKIAGRRLYNYARHGQEVELPQSNIKIYSLTIDKFSWPFLNFSVCVSAGTYIRALARDLGESLGCGAHLISLRRIAVGNFNINDAVSLDEITANNWFLFLIDEKGLI